MTSGDPRWPVTDGVIELRPPEQDDVARLVTGRDAESERWLGPGVDEPTPSAVIVVAGEVVGWVDHDTDQPWLGPGEVNVGYNVFATHRRNHYATRAVQLLLRWLAEHTDVRRAHLAIDVENHTSRGVARAVNAHPAVRYVNDKGRPNIRYVLEVGPH